MASAVKGFPEKFPVRDDDQRPLRYHIASFVGRACLTMLAWRRLTIVGEENIPAAGPLLVASNHLSNLDPFLLGGYFPRTLFALAKRELYVNRPVAWFLGGCNCIPVDREGADRRALARALEVLRRHGRLLVFIEGTRSGDGTMQRAEAGIGFLAKRGHAAILPVAISGTRSRGWRRGPLRRGGILLRYGRTFELSVDGPRDLVSIADEIALRVAALLPPSQRGVYGGGADA
ncbi:MAG: 1-acyl-sn-glycerol-3-phosphate acyltransferase [Candidatus Dormibacteraeota bacterium]|uniref:1-acyl-sn-glycerol-3-phosphate acyltransferase n=1 Tax=Candidatus Amunia macphersoniae TaxID=3127014 RepID=A0A934KL98_9BACT|nr:1-acyl-sn-glycerol-3-phosphate acyltransferase [Candidatus Dormibacteraeota bacterium]